MCNNSLHYYYERGFMIMKRLMLFILVCAFSFGIIICPASASSDSSDISPKLVGNGITQTTITFNGKEYTATVCTDYSPSLGMRVYASTPAYINVSINKLTVKYDTRNYGYITDEGGERIGHFSNSVNVVYGSYVSCSKGMGQVIDYISASGSATFFADNASTVSVSASN